MNITRNVNDIILDLGDSRISAKLRFGNSSFNNITIPSISNARIKYITSFKILYVFLINSFLV